MRIGPIDLDERVLIVAEIGNNHEGRLEVARELVKQAAGTGVDAVKFQTFRTEHYVSPANEVAFRRLKTFELTPDDFAELSQLAISEGVVFLSTPFDLASARMLRPLVAAFKIASGDNDFLPLIADVVESGHPVIISAGVATLEQITRTVRFARGVRTARDTEPDIAVLHCVTSYPAPPAQIHLRTIPLLAQALGCPIGYSDHTIGPDAAPLAVALGARIIEKHFTLDKHYSDFRDHSISSDPAEMREVVRRIRAAEILSGRAAKDIQPCEHAFLPAVRRSIVAARNLPAGHRVSLADLTWVRPGGGVPPGQEALLVGKVLRQAKREFEAILVSDVEKS